VQEAIRESNENAYTVRRRRSPFTARLLISCLIFKTRHIPHRRNAVHFITLDANAARPVESAIMERGSAIYSKYSTQLSVRAPRSLGRSEPCCPACLLHLALDVGSLRCLRRNKLIETCSLLNNPLVAQREITLQSGRGGNTVSPALCKSGHQCLSLIFLQPLPTTGRLRRSRREGRPPRLLFTHRRSKTHVWSRILRRGGCRCVQAAALVSEPE
jgi:hypothetical protein